MLFSLLSKLSRNTNKEGPSKKYYLKNNDLLGDNLTYTSYISEMKFRDKNRCDKTLELIDLFIKDKYCIIKFEEVENYQTKYFHYVIEVGKNKFYDDLEILKKNNYIKLRSSSRIGFYDMGMNKTRINEIITNIFNIDY